MNYLFGPKAINEAINNQYTKIKKIYLTKNKSSFLSNLNDKNINYQFVNDDYFNKFDSSLNHQFICAEIESNNYFNSIEQWIKINNNQDKKQLILILDEINDPRNFGSIIRTSYGLGVDAIIYKKDNQVQINDLVQKTSMGATSFIPLIKVSNLARTIETLKDNGYWIYASVLSDKSQDCSKIQYDNKTALIIGNENKGISDLLIKKSDFHIKINMSNNFDSLNVSVATGILVFNILNK
ncbi:MAG: 23S rRNA (guanosine(2251)-2'-O)-methyltransferase RlmB [Ureaplasma sp.]|nr:23S rRNA (guanosine(2251)-2'-O)-methyltransferase RlmB [Ureaplasma sp.]